MRIFFSLLVFSFVGSSIFSAEGSLKQPVEQENRLRKQGEDDEIKSIFQLIRAGKLTEAETGLEKSRLVPDDTAVYYCEWEQVGPFRRRSFECYLGGKSYFWGTLALEYLKKNQLLQAEKAYSNMNEKFAPRSKKKVKDAISKFIREIPKNNSV